MELSGTWSSLLSQDLFQLSFLFVFYNFSIRTIYTKMYELLPLSPQPSLSGEISFFD